MKSFNLPRALLFRRWVTAVPPWRHRRRNRWAPSQVVRKSRRKNKNAHDFFKYLPSEIMIDILLRLRDETIMRCKCVCKAWHDLLETRDFVQSHLSISVPAVAVYQSIKNQYKVIEFADEHHLNVVFKFDLPFISKWIVRNCSANGLIFVCTRSHDFVCNPITREYIRLPCPPEPSPKPEINMETYGFGVSKVSGQYKVVRIFHDGCWIYDRVQCQVYTVGTGSWRRIDSCDHLRYDRMKVGSFLNGNLHWLAYDISSDDDLICCLDLETECFSTFSPPPREFDCSYRTLSVLGNYLCVCDTFVERGIVFYIAIRLMKEYGDEKSWTDEFVIAPGYTDGDHCPIKVFKDGDMLMDWGSQQLLYYSSKSETFREVMYGFSFPYTPSFLPLKSFVMENVRSF